MINSYASEAEAREGLAGLGTMARAGTNLLPPFELFWGGFMSQWHEAPFSANGIKFATAEHWMMWNKARCFRDEQAAAMVLVSPHPKAAKETGRQVKNYDEGVWATCRYDIVRTGNLLKFSQNPWLLQKLQATGGRILVEASPHDIIWGIGRSEADLRARDIFQWRGANLLGFALMSVRYSLALLP